LIRQNYTQVGGANEDKCFCQTRSSKTFALYQSIIQGARGPKLKWSASGGEHVGDI